MKPTYHDLRSPKHQPVFLLPYIEYDGQYARQTDCEYLSLGWAQYGPPATASLKAFRYTGKKWSRQSEELPLHRAVDLVLLLAAAVGSARGAQLEAIKFPTGTFERQKSDLRISPRVDRGLGCAAFAKQITDKRIRARLKKLRGVLNTLHNI